MIDPKEPDITAIVMRCDQYNIPVATNIATAELLILGLGNVVTWIEIKSEMSNRQEKAMGLASKTRTRHGNLSYYGPYKRNTF